MKAASLLDRLTARGAGILAAAAALLVLCLSFLTVTDVLMRWLINTSIRGMSDMTLIAVIMITALCFPICSREGGHVRITLLGAVLPRLGARIVELFSNTVTLVFLGAIAWQAFQLMVEHHRHGQVTSVLNIGLGPIWAIAAVALGVTALIQLYLLLRHLSGRELEQGTKNQEPG
ncbi:MAG: TRAP transporter small permease [Roseovarius sp.]